jgi:rhodanese-related sulfurtransferase
MCRSGQRSVEALKDLENAGYKNLYNMKYGFEGSTDINGYRTLNGWKVEGLPYTFSGAGYQD